MVGGVVVRYKVGKMGRVTVGRKFGFEGNGKK